MNRYLYLTRSRHLLLFVVPLFLVLAFLPGQRSYVQADVSSPTTYLLTVYAPTSTARTQLVRAGFVPVAADLGAGTMTIVGDDAAWPALKQAGWPVLAVRPADFPPTDSAYHNYTEMVDEISRIAREHPEIVSVGVYGKSVEGRDLYVVKISDNVAKDESGVEPGIVFFANIHAREHLSAEQALWIIRHLAENYGREPAVTNLVNQREIWIMPMTNPDGVEYDIEKTGLYRWWRKNRRRNPDGTYGVDLNRNFAYKWGCCSGSSGVPGSEVYRGPAPFSEPETRAIRDFFLAHPSIRVSLNFHTFSELVLWPYGYTSEDLPSDMDPVDWQVMVRAGTHMARLSGYRPMQASDLYIADGISDDWVYGTLRIPTWTVELFPTDVVPGFYPPDEVIPEQTSRNRGLVEYVIALADEPRKILGTAGDVISPTVSLTSPTFTGTGAVFRVQASDNVGVTLLALQEGSRLLGLFVPPDPQPHTSVYTITIPLPEGVHRVNALAYDRAHNLGKSTPVIVNVPPAPGTRMWLPWIRREDASY